MTAKAKLCSDCLKERLLDDFDPKVHSADGRKAYCRECGAARKRARIGPTKRCGVCDTRLPVSDFYHHVRDGYTYKCKLCFKMTPPEVREIRRQQVADRVDDRRRCPVCNYPLRRFQERFCSPACRDKHERFQLLTEAIERLGRRCVCCQTEVARFLTLNGGTGLDHLRRIKAQGFPPDVRLLCGNCWASHQLTGNCNHGNMEPAAEPPFREPVAPAPLSREGLELATPAEVAETGNLLGI